MVFAQRTSTDLDISVVAITDSSVNENGQDYPAAQLGSVFRYNIDLNNLTDLDADSVVITQILPPDVTFMASSFAPSSLEENLLSWTLDELKGNETHNWDVSVFVNKSIPQDVDELVCFTSFTCSNDSVATNNSTTEIVKVLRPNYDVLDLRVELSVSTDSTVMREDQIYPAVFEDNTFQYSIRVFNNGPLELESIQVVQELAENVISSAQQPPADNQVGRQLVWFLPTLGIGADTTILIDAQGAYRNETPTLAFVRASALNETQTQNNVDSVAVWLLDKITPEPTNCDIELTYDVVVDSSAIVDGVEIKLARYYESFAYFINVVNNGPAVARDIYIENELPSGIGARLFNQQPDDSTSNGFNWQLDSLAVGESWSATVFVSVSDEITDFPHRAESSAFISAANDTLFDNNEKVATILILGDPITYPDLSLKQEVDADSFKVVDGDYIPIVRQNEYYRITVDLANWSLSDAQNAELIYVVDDSLTILGTSPTSDVFTADSVVWRFDAIPANSSAKYIIDVQVAPLMPEQQNMLHSVATVSAENEDERKTDNNQSVLKMVNVGVPAQPFEPAMSLTPEHPSVSDSIRVRVSFPVEIVDWDIWVYLPSGDIIKDFADAFIRSTEILPGEWYDIDVPFLHQTLMSENESDELIFEVHATGLYGIRATTRQQVFVNPGFDLVPPNVVEPGTTEIPIDFVVSQGHVAIKVFDISGRHIVDLVDDDYASGRHTLLWDGTTDNGRLVGSGVYLVTLHTEHANTFRKMIIVR
jgi:uncharacterized repeat protein (TIGR01451 family)